MIPNIYGVLIRYISCYPVTVKEEQYLLTSDDEMPSTTVKKPEYKNYLKQQRPAFAPIDPVKIPEETIRRKVHEYRVLMKSLPKEEIEEILQKSIGSRNMLKLFAMMNF